jgi:hypothetical protein
LPGLNPSITFYKAFLNWNPSQGGNEAFWFMFFDRQPTDNSMGVELEKYFGFFTWHKRSKAADYPQRLSSFVYIPTPAPTPAPTAAPKPAPRVTSKPSVFNGGGGQVCRVIKKRFVSK